MIDTEVKPNMDDLPSLVADDLAIRTLCHRFSHCVISRDAQAFRACWTADGVWDIGAPMNVHLVGVDAITEGFTHLMTTWEFFVQMPHAGVVDVTGNRATASWVMNEVGKPVQQPGQPQKGHLNYSTYTDELVRENGVWRFSLRRYRFLYLDETPLAGQVL